MEDESVSNKAEAYLLNFLSFNQETNQDFDLKIPINAPREEDYNYIQSFKKHQNSINDVEWAPLAGRSFHLVASCSKDRKVIIWRIV